MHIPKNLALEPTPFFVFDLDRITENYERLREALHAEDVYYAVKANNHPLILSTLQRVGAKFEVGSAGELRLLEQLDVPPSDVIFSVPVKLIADIDYAYSIGVGLYVFDSEVELSKLAEHAPGVRVVLRISVSNEGSMFPLNNKFGAAVEEAATLLSKAQQKKLVPYGLAFHVGSQCERKETWVEAIETALQVWNEVGSMPLRLLNIGGGFPARYREDTISIEEIAAEINRAVSLFPPEARLVLEPGRIIVADAGRLVASVIGMAERNGRDWLYLDIGALHGLFEAVQASQKFPYRIVTEKRSQTWRNYIVTGPTCDPDDTILEDVRLPEMEIEDKVIIMNTGAYSMVYAMEFGGFPPPRAYFLQAERRLPFEEAERLIPD